MEDMQKRIQRGDIQLEKEEAIQVGDADLISAYEYQLFTIIPLTRLLPSRKGHGRYRQGSCEETGRLSMLDFQTLALY